MNERVPIEVPPPSPEKKPPIEETVGKRILIDNYQEGVVERCDSIYVYIRRKDGGVFPYLYDRVYESGVSQIPRFLEDDELAND